MIKVNGKHYPLWSQFVERKKDWIGGILEDFGDNMDQALGLINGSMKTEITDILLEPNGKDSAKFMVVGKDFSCGFDVRYGGLDSSETGWLGFFGYGDHRWRIQKNR